jgi:hypothetical protein
MTDRMAYFSPRINKQSIIMGKSVNYITGKITGRIGAVVFRIVKGQNISSVHQPNVANPRTEAQQVVRMRQTVLVALYRAMASLFQVGFRTAQNPLSPYNWFMKTNNPAAVTGSTPETVEVDYENLIVSKGTMGINPEIDCAASEGGETAVWTWDKDLEPVGSSPTDRLCVGYIHKTTGEKYAAVTTIQRSTGTGNVPPPFPIVENEEWHSYAFFRSMTDNSVSDSQYRLVTVGA